MTRMLRVCALLLALPVATTAQPLGDHHQHLIHSDAGSADLRAADHRGGSGAPSQRRRDQASRGAVYRPGRDRPLREDPNLRRGLKLHFGNSMIDYQNAAHIEQLRRVFRAANSLGMAIVVHMRVNTNEKFAYRQAEALVFLNELVAAAPDVPVQIGHLAGAGGHEYPMIDPILDVLVEALARKEPRMTRLV